VGYIHLMQLNVSPQRKTSTLGPCQHGWADVDANDLGPRWVKLNISTSPNTRIQHPPLEPLKEQGPYLAIAAVLEGKIEQVIERCDPLVWRIRCRRSALRSVKGSINTSFGKHLAAHKSNRLARVA